MYITHERVLKTKYIKVLSLFTEYLQLNIQWHHEHLQVSEVPNIDTKKSLKISHTTLISYNAVRHKAERGPRENIVSIISTSTTLQWECQHSN